MQDVNGKHHMSMASTTCQWQHHMSMATPHVYFKLKHVSTTEMIADGLTKPLGKDKFAQFVKMIGVGPFLW
jgi:hypothetical protein